MTRSAKQFKRGFFSLFAGLSLVFGNPRVRRLAVLPFLISMIVMIGGFFSGVWVLGSTLPAMAQGAIAFFGLTDGTFLFTLLYWTTLVLLWPVSFFALFYLLFVISRLIATPFYALMAERVLIERGQLPEAAFSTSVWLRVSARIFGVSLVKLIAFVMIGAVLFVLSFIPGFAIFTAFGFLLMAAFDVVDLSFEALQMGFRQRFSLFQSEFPAFAGLACMLGLVFWVPGLNFFLFPAAIAGGSELVRTEPR